MQMEEEKPGVTDHQQSGRQYNDDNKDKVIVKQHEQRSQLSQTKPTEMESKKSDSQSNIPEAKVGRSEKKTTTTVKKTKKEKKYDDQNSINEIEPTHGRERQTMMTEITSNKETETETNVINSPTEIECSAGEKVMKTGNMMIDLIKDVSDISDMDKIDIIVEKIYTGTDEDKKQRESVFRKLCEKIKEIDEKKTK